MCATVRGMEKRKNRSTLDRLSVAQLAADSVIREWILKNGTRVQTVTLQQDDGRFVSAAVSRPELRASGDTRQAAEGEVLKRLAGLGTDDEPPETVVDDLRVARQRSRERSVPLAELKKKYGYR